MTSKCDKIKKVAQEASVSLMFLPHFDFFCKVIFNWTDSQQQKLSMMTSSVCLSSNRTWVRTIQDACVIQLIIRLTPAIYLFPGQLAVAYVVYVYSWVNRGTVRLKCFAQNTAHWLPGLSLDLIFPEPALHLWDHSISHLWFSKNHCCSCLAFQDFFLNVKDILRKPEDTTPSAHNYHELEKDLQDKYGSLCFPVLAWIY